MYLTKDEEKIYDGEHGSPYQKAMEILVSIGDIYGADKLIKVSSSHICGTSYKSSEEAGMRFVEKLAAEGAHFSVKTTLNPIGIDLENFTDMNVPEEFVEKQMAIVSSYRKMGGIEIYSCIPYQVGNIPRFGEHLAWSDSNTIIFSNSVLGARVNRESNPSAIAAALIGKTPRFGNHLEDNRHGNLIVEVEEKIRGTHEYMALGHYVGASIGAEVPIFTNVSMDVSLDELKCLGAALATSGSTSIFHSIGITPEARTLEKALAADKPLDKICVGRRELDEVYEEFCTSTTQEVDYILLGCPHASLDEVKRVSNLLELKRINSDVKLWICTSKGIKAFADRMGYTDIIEKAGGLVVCDTCSVNSPVKEMGSKVMATNSIKAARYNSEIDDLQTFLGSIEDCVDAAINGRWGFKKHYLKRG